MDARMRCYLPAIVEILADGFDRRASIEAEETLQCIFVYVLGNLSENEPLDPDLAGGIKCTFCKFDQIISV